MRSGESLITGLGFVDPGLNRSAVGRRKRFQLAPCLGKVAALCGGGEAAASRGQLGIVLIWCWYSVALCSKFDEIAKAVLKLR